MLTRVWLPISSWNSEKSTISELCSAAVDVPRWRKHLASGDVFTCYSGAPFEDLLCLRPGGNFGCPGQLEHVGLRCAGQELAIGGIHVIGLGRFTLPDVLRAVHMDRPTA